MNVAHIKNHLRSANFLTPLMRWYRTLPRSTKLAIPMAFLIGVGIGPIMKRLNSTSSVATDDAADAKPVPVATQPVKLRTILHQFTTNSYLQPKKEIILRPNNNVVVREVRVEVGQQVKRGDVLAYTDSEAQRLRSELDEIDLKQKNLDYSVTLALAKKSFISTKEFAQKQLEYRASGIRKRLSELETTGAIHSPIDGVVSEIAIKSGDYIDNPSQYFIKIADNSSFRIQLYLPQTVASRLTKGMFASLTRARIDDFGKETTEFAARNVLAIAPVVDPKSGSVLTDIEVQSVPKGWIGGQYVQLALTIEQANQVVAVPNDAIIVENNRSFVYRIPGPDELAPDEGRSPAAESKAGERQPARVVKEAVTFGLRDAKYTEIRSGIEENDTIVVEGQGNLSDNAAVEVVRE